MGSYKSNKLVSATSYKFFKNTKNSQSKWGKVLFTWILNRLGNIYIKGFSSGHL
jgi:hypothetical protein